MKDQSQNPDRPTPESWMDEIIEVYKRDVDRTLIRENLKLSVEQRLRNLEAGQRGIEALQDAMRRARKSE
jgi:hypothetical protein